MTLSTIFIALIVFISILLILIIMVQNPKGGGLSSAIGGSGSQIVGGVKNTGTFLDRSTWTLATLLVVLILLSNTIIKNYNAPIDKTPVEETLESPKKNDNIPLEKSNTIDATDSSGSTNENGGEKSTK